jgi:hypothetical protein
MFPVLNQQQTEACVSHTWVRLLQIYWYKKTGKVINFSPRFLHAITSKGMKPNDGRDPRTVGQVLTDIGCCTTALLPNDTSLDDSTYSYVPITQSMLNEALQYKIPAYSFIPIDQYSIRHAIYHKGAVAFLFYIGNEWWTPSWSPRDINPLRSPKIVVGGHEVTGEHWNTLEGIQNSWGDSWDERGFAEYNLSNYSPVQAICIDDPLIDFNPSASFKFMKDLYYGMTDPDVKQLQIRLGMPIKYQTSYFGTITLAYAISYQITHGIVPQWGYVGLKTRSLLNLS